MSTLKDQWVAALLSGEYQQGENRLRSNDGAHYCCLGVLCDLVDKSGWEDQDHPANIGHNYAYMYDGVSSQTTLPSNMNELVGLNRNQISHLVGLNDAGKTFADIARVIESGNYGFAGGLDK